MGDAETMKTAVLPLPPRQRRSRMNVQKKRKVNQTGWLAALKNNTGIERFVRKMLFRVRQNAFSSIAAMIGEGHRNARPRAYPMLSLGYSPIISSMRRVTAGASPKPEARLDK
jgi:hypothetical protein